MTLDGLIQTSIAGLALGPLRRSDAETFYALVQKNRAHLTALGDFEQEVAVPLEKWVDEFSADLGAGCRLGIFLSGQLVGRTDLIAVDPPKYSVGYWLAEDAVGHGYASAALARVEALARDELGASDIYAGVTHGNARSEALLEGLGFARVAEFERYARFHLSL